MNKNIKHEKAILRDQLKTLRASLPISERENISAQLQQQLKMLIDDRLAERIFVYISYGTEMETHSLIDRLLQEGKQVGVPKLLDRETMVAVQLTDWNQLQKAELGILSPTNTTPVLTEFDLTITPGLGFTRQGHRLGYGAGYYDRWFADNSPGLKLAPIFNCQLVDSLPTDEFDQAVDLIFTETEKIEINSV